VDAAEIHFLPPMRVRRAVATRFRHEFGIAHAPPPAHHVSIIALRGYRVRVAAVLLFATATMGVAGCTRVTVRENAPITEAAAVAAQFPADWVGRYEGPLEITRPGEPMVVPMTIEIAPTDSADRWHWHIQYEGQPVREYMLVRQQDGSWMIDEQNSIVLPLAVRGNRAFSAFSVSGSLLVATYTRTARGLDFEVITLPAEAAATSGGEGPVPTVGIFPQMGYQRGELARVTATE
jgi:hypothetical protein